MREIIQEIINKEPLPIEGQKWEWSKKLADEITEALLKQSKFAETKNTLPLDQKHINQFLSTLFITWSGLNENIYL
jgi:hypothetical protein